MATTRGRPPSAATENGEIQVVLRPGLSFAYGTVSVSTCPLQCLCRDFRERGDPALSSMHKRQAELPQIQQLGESERQTAAPEAIVMLSPDNVGISATSMVSIPLIL